MKVNNVMDIRKPIQVNEAITKVMNFAIEGRAYYVPIEKSYGFFLGEDLVADHFIPQFDRSLYDGFAVQSKDTLLATCTHPVKFEVIGEIAAGQVFPETVKAMQAVRIMTGAPIPNECDAVEMLEAVEELTLNRKLYIQVKRTLHAGTNISFTGEDIRKGVVLAAKGTYINPGIVALLATFGYKKVPVSKKPRIGILSTGSELLELDEPLKPGKIRNSNAYMIISQVIRAGGEPVYLGQCLDDFETCYRKVLEGMEETDMVITTGGVSVGDYDYVPAIYDKLGANILFNKIAMRPGSVTTVAEKSGKLLFGLSGNPSACYVGFELFARPVIRTFLHASKPLLKKEIAILDTDFPKSNPFDRFVRGYLSYQNGKLVATPVGLDKSNIVSSLVEANILIELSGGNRKYEQGKEVSILLLEDQEGMAYKAFIDSKRSIRNG